MASVQEKSCSVIATNLPTDVSRREIQEFFSEVGPVKKCHLVRDKNGVFKGMAYIIYTLIEDATQAVEKFNDAAFSGKTIRVKWSRQRKTEEADEEGDAGSKSVGEREDGEEKEKKERKQPKKENKIKKPKKQRNGRVIIRNLSFKANEKIVEDHFSNYGKISEVSILRKKDGKMVGCAFIQFSTKAEAMKAIRNCNMQPLLGRPIAVDFAVAKEKFSPNEVKKETIQDEDKVKVEVLSDDEGEEKVENINIKEEKVSSDGEESDSGVDDGEDDDIMSVDGEEPSTPVKTVPLPTKGPSKDIVEQRTLFIKNLPFIATQEEIAEVLKKYGEVKYVLLCMDQLTEHPRGTAFAQFKEREAADACLAAEANPSTKNELILHGRPMHIMRAVSRTELDQRKNEKGQEKAKKDNRNLFLAREGFVRQGTQAAIGLSSADIALRIKREQVKRRMLQNLNIFVSTTRLCINNLPQRIGDKQLFTIFIKHSPQGAKLTEARIMRDFKDVDENGKPKSRGYGFVTFTEHEHALAALRKINNNPDIFTNDQRPIVEFSLENRSVLNARQKRVEKSREKNPLWKKDEQGTKHIASKKDMKNIPHQVKKPVEKSETQEEEIQPSFIGSRSNPSNKILPANIGPKIRHRDRNSSGKGKISRKQFRKEQKDRALGRKRKRPINEDVGDSSSAKKSAVEETEGQGKTKRKRNKKKISNQMKTDIKDERAFNSMVRKYKEKMSSVDSSNNKRWFED